MMCMDLPTVNHRSVRPFGVIFDKNCDDMFPKSVHTFTSIKPVTTPKLTDGTVLCFVSGFDHRRIWPCILPRNTVNTGLIFKLVNVSFVHPRTIGDDDVTMAVPRIGLTSQYRVSMDGPWQFWLVFELLDAYLIWRSDTCDDMYLCPSKQYTSAVKYITTMTKYHAQLGYIIKPKKNPVNSKFNPTGTETGIFQES